jgi:hypothetical protein
LKRELDVVNTHAIDPWLALLIRQLGRDTSIRSGLCKCHSS